MYATTKPEILRSKGNVFNGTLPAQNTDLLTTSITTLEPVSYLNIYVALSIDGVFSVKRTRGVTSVSEKMNSGIALTGGCGYGFTIPIRSDDTINFTTAVTGGTYNLIVEEAI